MNQSRVMDEEQLIKQAVKILVDHLGILEATRFLALRPSSVPRLESVERHQLWQAQLDKDKFFDEVFKVT